MAGSGPADLHAQCLEILSASVDALDTIPSLAPGLLGAPERAFVSAGTPALDCCNQLTVNAAPIAEAPTAPLEMGSGTRHQQGLRKNYVGFQITITRCGPPTGDLPPSADELEAVAEQCNADAWALWNYLWNEERSGALFTICGGVFNDRLAPLTPSGGCYGWVFSFRGEVEGYEAAP
jgi:hypothetical protein